MRRRWGVYAVLGVLLYLVALIVTVLLCLVFVSPAPAKPHPKGGKGKHDFEGLYIVSADDAVVMVPDASGWQAVKVGEPGTRLRHYDCRVTVVGGTTRYDADETIQRCYLKTVDE